MPPVVIGGAIAAAGAVTGAVISSNGAKSAANASAAAADRSAQVQQDIFNQNKATLAPYVATGLPATNQINALLGIAPTTTTVDWNGYANANPDLMAAYNAQPGSWIQQAGNQMAADPSHAIGTAVGSLFGHAFGGNTTQQVRPDLATFAQQWHQQHGGDLGAYTTTTNPQDAANAAFDQFRHSTGYDFRLKQGMNAVNSGYAGAGTIKSGAAIKAAEDYGQGMASQEFGNYLNALGTQQGVGLNAAGAQAGVATNYANNLGSIYMQNGANQANASLAKASAIGSGIAGAANSIGSVLAPSYGATTFNPTLSASMTNNALSQITPATVNYSNQTSDWRSW